MTTQTNMSCRQSACTQAYELLKQGIVCKLYKQDGQWCCSPIVEREVVK